MNGRHLGVVAGVLFVPAWFLTAAHTSGELIGGRSAGWQAFLFAISPLFGNDVAEGLLLRSWMITSALSNALLVFTLGLVVWRPAAVHRILAGSQAAATVLNAYWIVLPSMRTDLRVGYYLWLAAFVVGTGAAWVTTRERADVGARA